MVNIDYFPHSSMANVIPTNITLVGGNLMRHLNNNLLLTCCISAHLSNVVMSMFRTMMKMVCSGVFLVAVTRTVASHRAALPVAAWVN